MCHSVLLKAFRYDYAMDGITPHKELLGAASLPLNYVRLSPPAPPCGPLITHRIASTHSTPEYSGSLPAEG